MLSPAAAWAIITVVEYRWTDRIAARKWRNYRFFLFGDTAVRILQLTDFHVFCEPNCEIKGIPTRECFQDVVDFIVKNETSFDHVIVTGDHTHDEKPESYAAVQNILAPLGNRIWQVPGNHDERRVLRTVFSNIPGTNDEFINFAFGSDEWLCVGLDTHVPGEVAGCIESKQIAWLREKLQASTAKNVALFCHHPPVDVNSIWMDEIGLSGRELLHDVISGDPRIRLICCGHVHHDFQSSYATAEIYATPSTGIQFDPNGNTPNFSSEAPGYRVIDLNADGFSTEVRRLPEIKYKPVVEG